MLVFFKLFIVALVTFTNSFIIYPTERLLATPIYFIRNITKNHNDPNPLIKPALKYHLVLVGDSMIERSGNFEMFRSKLSQYYPNKNFDIDNYGFGSTNILSLQDRLEKPFDHLGQKYKPILDIDFQIVFIESFGHNPLSQFKLAEGLKKQNESIDQAILTIRKSHPKSSIVLIATISPNSSRYAEGVVVLLPEKRKEWADERTAYIKNFIKYANDHRLPLVNIYQKSLDASGNGNIDYIDTKDFIHPSPTGLRLISDEIADYIFKARLLPL